VSARPSVSVLLPVYNAAPHLDACLSSLHRQTLTDLEIVAVDDGSSDASPEILAHWCRKDRRLRLLRRAHSGLVAALNDGLAACRGELVARMDADDLAAPTRLEVQRDELVARPEVDVLGCLVRHFSASRLGTGMRIYDRWLNGLLDDAAIKRDRFIESPLVHPSVMARRAVLFEAGGYRDRGWPEDYDLWLRLAARGCRFAKVERLLLAWRDHERRLSRADARYAVERFLECKAHHLMRGPLAGERRVIVWGAGRTGRRLAAQLLRRGAPLAAFVDIDPRKQGRSLRGLPIVAPSALERLRSGPDGPAVVLAAVAARGARARIRDHLAARGWRETDDFWLVA
jgi:glycosyltransferase involved in cell wall biosynthesis